MPLPRPDYLAYTVPCPLNAGKLAQVAAFQAAHPGVSRASGKPLARGRRDDPRLGNPYFSVVLEAALKAGHPTPTIGVCSV